MRHSFFRCRTSPAHDRGTSYHSLLNRAATLLAFVVAIVMLSTSASTAQPCPTGWLPATITISMTLSCPTASNPVNVTAHICYPDSAGPVNPKHQYILQWIEYDAATINCDMTADEMRELGDSIITNNPGHFVCNAVCDPWCEEHPFCPCASLCPQWSISWASCWKVITGGPTIRPCDGYGYCQDQYNVCRYVKRIKPNGDTVWAIKTYLAGAVGGTHCEGNAALDPKCKLVCPNALPPKGPGDTCDAVHGAAPPRGEEIGSTYRSHDHPHAERAAGSSTERLAPREGAVALRPKE